MSNATGHTNMNSAIEAIEKSIKEDSELMESLNNRKAKLLATLVEAQNNYDAAEKRTRECRVAIMKLRADELDESNATRSAALIRTPDESGS